MLNISSLETLQQEISRLPGIGPKTAQRLIHYILRRPEYSKDLRKALEFVEESVTLCTQCFSYTDEASGICHFCTNPRRKDDAICVVESPENISLIDASGAFDGRYHVLHGVISPLDGITPEQLKIQPLIERIDQLLLEAPESKIEIILALDADLEGDTTMLYLAKLFSDRDQVHVSRLAQGVPIGSHLDFVDHRTLSRALENRVKL